MVLVVRGLYPHPVTSCSFCGKDKSQVERLIEGGGRDLPRPLPKVRICNECIAFCNQILSELDEPVPELLRDWSQLDYKGETYRWSAVKTTVRRGPERELKMMILVGRLGEAAPAMLFPDGTEPTEARVIEAIHRLLLEDD